MKFCVCVCLSVSLSLSFAPQDVPLVPVHMNMNLLLRINGCNDTNIIIVILDVIFLNQISTHL